ncbi:MAG: bifunctional non-homologous end joining protein LigD [Ilumatobacter sp.]|jgi:bifunctional non-homologous end joining protein LigD
MSLAFPVAPMKAGLGSIPAGDGWAFEVKWDGYRTLVFVSPEGVLLQSSSGKDVTDRWPEFAGLANSLNASTAILDAELLVFDDDGRPDFALVQRSGVGSDREAVLHIFDVLSVNETDTIDLSYLNRRNLLDSLIEPSPNWLVPANQIGDGDALLAATAAQGLEGVIAKRVDSMYRPGTRSKDWIKVKNRIVVEVVIGGFTSGMGNRADSFGALLVGRPNDHGKLVFAGGVGTGFDQATLISLRRRLDALTVDECPFSELPAAKHRRGAQWVAPELRASVEIAEFTNDGHVRHASFIGLAS